MTPKVRRTMSVMSLLSYDRYCAEIAVQAELLTSVVQGAGGLRATDTSPQASAEWVIDLAGDTIAWRRAHEKAAVAVRGPLTDLLLVVYKRRAVRGGDIQILGDAQLPDFWLERVSFG